MKRQVDYFFLGVSGLLLLFGFIMIFSTTPTLGLKIGDPFYYIKRHVIYLILGFVALIAALRMPVEELKKKAWLICGASWILLFLVHIPLLGRKIGGAARWIDLGLISIQPSEIAKVGLVIFLSHYFILKNSRLWVALGAILLPCMFVLAEPDLGTALIIFSTGFLLLFLKGFSTKALVSIGFAAMGGVLALAIATPYRLRRLLAFLDPWKDPQDIGFQMVQSLLAIGSGGLLGLGLGGSRQKFFYLPQHYTDFIFAVVAEELGFVGATLLVTLFLLWIMRGFRIARYAATPFERYLAGGLVGMIAIQACLNVGVVTGLLPTTGIPLPLISYGGTSLVVTLFSVGLLLNISRRCAFSDLTHRCVRNGPPSP